MLKWLKSLFGEKECECTKGKACKCGPKCDCKKTTKKAPVKKATAKKPVAKKAVKKSPAKKVVKKK